MRKFIPHFALSVFFAAAGLLIGAVISPNYMKFHVDALGKISLAPQNGDILDWDGIDPSSSVYPVAINFPGTSPPCAPTALLSKGICIVQYPDPLGSYLYFCNTTSGTQVCSDPNIGPQSVTGGNGGEGLAGASGPSVKLWVRGALDRIKAWFLPGVARSQGVAQSANRDLTPGAPQGLAAAGTTGSSSVYVEVDCNGGTTKVTPESITNVSQGSKILWEGPHGPNGFTLGGLSSVCTMNGNLCTINSGQAGTHTYTATANSCNPDSTPTIVVNP